MIETKTKPRMQTPKTLLAIVLAKKLEIISNDVTLLIIINVFIHIINSKRLQRYEIMSKSSINIHFTFAYYRLDCYSFYKA